MISQQKLQANHFFSPHLSVSFPYLTSKRNTNDKFYGKFIGTRASRDSTAGYSQYEAMCKVVNMPIDFSAFGIIKIEFGIGCPISIGSIILDTPIRKFVFHIVKKETSFLLSLRDMDR